MKSTATVARTLVRITGPLLIVLGLLFWTGNALSLIPVHVLLGITLVVSLWVLAFVAARSAVNPRLVAIAAVWGAIVPVLGATQDQILVGSAHWVIRVLHLAVGIVAMALADRLYRQILDRGFVEGVPVTAQLSGER